MKILLYINNTLSEILWQGDFAEQIEITRPVFFRDGDEVDIRVEDVPDGVVLSEGKLKIINER